MDMPLQKFDIFNGMDENEYCCNPVGSLDELEDIIFCEEENTTTPCSSCEPIVTLIELDEFIDKLDEEQINDNF